MYLFLLYIVLIILFTTASPLSIFVKISWRENGEEVKYYQYLDKKPSERFNLELTNNLLDNPIHGQTNGYDTYHFSQADPVGKDGKQITSFNLGVSMYGNNVRFVF
uniref:Uncharacterized protein n=1 Tax=Meloidogyne floridensis TaxID=298350 RepID=A0A915NC12_9BILA